MSCVESPPSGDNPPLHTASQPPLSSASGLDLRPAAASRPLWALCGVSSRAVAPPKRAARHSDPSCPIMPHAPCLTPSLLRRLHCLPVPCRTVIASLPHCRTRICNPHPQTPARSSLTGHLARIGPCTLSQCRCRLPCSLVSSGIVLQPHRPLQPRTVVCFPCSPHCASALQASHQHPTPAPQPRLRHPGPSPVRSAAVSRPTPQPFARQHCIRAYTSSQPLQIAPQHGHSHLLSCKPITARPCQSCCLADRWWLSAPRIGGRGICSFDPPASPPCCGQST